MMTTLTKPGPRTVKSAIAIIKSGNALMPSISELTIETNARFYTKASKIPKIVPIASGIVTPKNATPMSDGTAVKVRDKTSRPN